MSGCLNGVGFYGKRGVEKTVSNSFVVGNELCMPLNGTPKLNF